MIGAELSTATTLDERLGVLWRNVSSPVAGDGRWIALEHELWSYAARNPEAREHLARRYRGAWNGIADGRPASGPASPPIVGPAVIGLLFGLEMMRRVDPDAVTDELAIDALRGVVAGTTRGSGPMTLPIADDPGRTPIDPPPIRPATTVERHRPMPVTW